MSRFIISLIFLLTFGMVLSVDAETIVGFRIRDGSSGTVTVDRKGICWKKDSWSGSWCRLIT
jgi:hypothetical protein